MISGPGRAVAGAVILAAAALGFGLIADPAAASVCDFSIASPTVGSAVSVSEVTFRGPFKVSGEGERTLEVAFTGSPGPLPASVTRQGAAVGPVDSYEVKVTGLDRNGQYTARVRATHTVVALCEGAALEAPTTVDKTVTFGVSVKAQRPQNVRSRFDAGPRAAVVTWEKSSDPDIAAYSISRRVGTAASEPVADLPPTPTTWTDVSLPTAAASVTYAVTAYRTGAMATTRSEASEPVAAGPLAVPARPGSTPPTAARPTVAVRPPAGTRAPAVVPTITAPGALPAPPPLLSLPGSLYTGGANQSPQTAVPSPDEGLIPLLGTDASLADGGGDGGGRARGLAYVSAAALTAATAALVLRRKRRRPARQGSPAVVAEALPVAVAEEPAGTFVPAPPADWAADDLPAPFPAPASKLILVVKPPGSGAADS